MNPVKSHNRGRARSFKARYGEEARAGVTALAQELGRRPNGRERQVIRAYVTVLHRLPDLAALAEYSKYETTHEIAQSLSISEEARAKGVSSLDYGDSLVNPAELDPSLRPYYAVWRQQVGPGVPLTTYTVSQLEQYKHAGDPRFMAAEMSGQIQHEASMSDGKIQAFSVVSPAAIKTMGGSYTGIGNDPGDIVLIPTSASLAKGDEWQSGDSFRGRDGGMYTVYGAKGHQTDGVLGWLGYDPDKLPDWVAPVVDTSTAGLGSYFMGGGEMHEDTSRLWSDKLGSDFEEWYYKVHSVGMYAIPVVGWAAGPLYNALLGWAQHSGGLDVDMNKVWTRAGMGLAGGRLFGGTWSGRAAWAAATTKATGGSWDEAAESAAWSAFNSAANSYFGDTTKGAIATVLARTVVDGEQSWENTLLSVAATMAQDAASRDDKPTGAATPSQRLDYMWQNTFSNPVPSSTRSFFSGSTPSGGAQGPQLRATFVPKERQALVRNDYSAPAAATKR